MDSWNRFGSENALWVVRFLIIESITGMTLTVIKSTKVQRKSTKISKLTIYQNGFDDVMKPNE